MRISRLTNAVVILSLLCILAPALPVRPRRPNILLITVEALRRDHCSLYGYERDTTPFLRQLAKESIVFDNAWSHSSWTYPSMACVLSGRLQQGHGVWHAASEPQMPILWWLNALKDAGYQTAAHVTNRFVTRLIQSSSFADCTDKRQRRGVELLRETVRWLADGQREPWCVFWHLYDPHDPYDAPAEIERTYCGGYVGRLALDSLRVCDITDRGPISAAESAYVEARYDEEVLYVDRILGTTVAMLRQMGHWRNTCLVLTADHGEFFGEHGRWGHGGAPHREVTEVPFLVRLPGGRLGGRRTNALVGGIDVLPTLLRQAGMEVPAELPGVDAVSLLDDPRPGRTIEQHHVGLDWQNKRSREYRLTSHVRAVVCGQRQELTELPIPPDQAAPRRGDAQVLADLRDLGYL